MKIIHADWEMRNLGIDSIEFYLEKNDSIEQLQQAEDSLKDFKGLVTYIVPAGKCHEQTRFLEEHGYYFDQAIVEGVNNFSETQTLFSHMQSLIEGYSVREITQEEDMERICNEIRKGIFSNQRYASLTELTDEKYNQRAAYWLRDWFLQRKIVLMEVINLQGKGIGFFSYEQISNIQIKGHLSGAYVDYKETENAGVILTILAQKHYRMNFKKSYGNMSSNNLAVLRIEGKLGERIRKISYYFSKMRE